VADRSAIGPYLRLCRMVGGACFFWLVWDCWGMAIEAIKSVVGRAVPVPGADVDTDRIIPARFLKCVTFDDLAEGLFYDERFDGEGVSKGHPVDSMEYTGAEFLVVGPNFGCGSSREHAPQSIRRFGFRAIIGVSFAEIFFGNSTNLGMPCVCLSAEDNEKLMGMVSADPKGEMDLDLEAMEVKFGGEVFKASMDEGAREALVSGKWDVIGELVGREGAIDERAKALGYV